MKTQTPFFDYYCDPYHGTCDALVKHFAIMWRIIFVFYSLLVGCGAGDISSGGGPVEIFEDPTADVSGTWTGEVSAIVDASDRLPITVELIQSGTNLTGSVEIPRCFPRAPITSGTVLGNAITEGHTVSFEASGDGRRFTLQDLAFSEPPITGLCSLTPGPACLKKPDPADLCLVTLSRSG